jgi:flagellar basal-body rod protein FlgG
MLRALHTAALGMSAQQTSVDNTANNLANANTTGFKRSNVVFQDLLYQTVQTAGQGEGQGAGAPATLQMGHGASAISTVRNFKQGSFVETSNAFDLAVSGDGFFQVRTPGGELAYTRDGSFTVNADGQVVTQTGLALEPDINVPQDAVEVAVSQDGVVTARLQGQPEMVELGQIELARFFNPAGLRAMGGNLYAQTESSGEPTPGMPGEEGIGMVRQGYVEASNVDVVQEMVALISAQRAYEINSKMVTTSEDMLQIANNLKR